MVKINRLGNQPLVPVQNLYSLFVPRLGPIREMAITQRVADALQQIDPESRVAALNVLTDDTRPHTFILCETPLAKAGTSAQEQDALRALMNYGRLAPLKIIN